MSENRGKLLWEEKEISTVRLSEDDRNEILRYVGYTGQKITPEFEAQFEICIEKINRVAQPRVQACLIECNPKTGEWPESLSFLTGQGIHNHLEGCREVLLFGATIGSGVDRAIHVEEVRDPVQAVIMDSCGSTLVEAVCDSFEAILRRRYETGSEKRYITTRFSPGYGDLPLEIQNHFAQVIEARRIGLTVTPEHIMIPRKSVTAIIGIADKPLGEKKRSCDACNLKSSCRFRKHGVLCGE